MTQLPRRHMLALCAIGLCAPGAALADAPTDISWADLIPPGVPYAEIIAQGERNAAKDFWRPVFDANATQLNPAFDGAIVRLGGFIVPLDMTALGVTRFLLVPYAGACIHTPPPPANQLVLVTTPTPWPGLDLWAPVSVAGLMQHDIQSTELGKTGYTMLADTMEDYEW